jgi:hypothetical protein
MFGSRSGDWEIVPASRAHAGQLTNGIDQVEAEEYLQQFKLDLMAMLQLRRLLISTDPVCQFSDDEVIRVVASRLASGEFVLGRPTSIRKQTTSSPGGPATREQEMRPPGGATDNAKDQTKPLSPKKLGSERSSKPKHWVAIRLVGDDGKPIPNEKYRITLHDGSVREGALNASGEAWEENVEPGQCKIIFPNIHAEEWADA